MKTYDGTIWEQKAAEKSKMLETGSGKKPTTTTSTNDENNDSTNTNTNKNTNNNNNKKKAVDIIWMMMRHPFFITIGHLVHHLLSKWKGENGSNWINLVCEDGIVKRSIGTYHIL
jgi:hypothetical protein